VPPEAEALLAVGRLRAACHRTGVREVVVTKAPAFGGGRSIARLSPLRLKMSQTIRLSRLYKGSLYKEEAAQVHVPLRNLASAPDELVELLGTILPPTAADAAPVVPQGAA
jgi:transcription-repair coupling factor (superfamily II helicase)